MACAAAHDNGDTHYLSFKLPTQHVPREQVAPGLPEGTELIALLHMLEKKGDAGKVQSHPHPHPSSAPGRTQRESACTLWVEGLRCQIQYKITGEAECGVG